jgi:hypothetical protein
MAGWLKESPRSDDRLADKNFSIHGATFRIEPAILLLSS